MSTAMLVGALYGGLATGQHIVAYRQQLADRHAARPNPGCVSYLPHGQLDAARHHRAARPGSGPPGPLFLLLDVRRPGSRGRGSP